MIMILYFICGNKGTPPGGAIYIENNRSCGPGIVQGRGTAKKQVNGADLRGESGFEPLGTTTFTTCSIPPSN